MTAGEPQGTVHIPYAGRWATSRAERIADAVVHGIGLAFAAGAGGVLLAMSFARTGTGEFAAAIFYVASLLAALTISLVYNQWPISPVKWMLRRFDHSAIYLLIAGTYTPFLVQIPDPKLAIASLAFVWTAALAGMAVKIFLPGRFDRLAVLFYLAIGWSGVALAESLSSTLPPATLTLIAAGGLAYTVGVIFYAWRNLRFQAAVWHAFVVTGAALHSIAVIDCLVISRL